MNYTNISAIFPAYNEEKNLQTLVKNANKILLKYFSNYEIIIVDDGSIDSTLKTLKWLQKEYPNLKIITHSQNLGYGAAIKDGLRSAKNELVFFSDADNQFNFEEIQLLLNEINNYDVVIGFRNKRKDNTFRLINAWMWNIINRTLFRIRYKDVNCAFKLFNRKILDKINLQNIHSNGATINIEILVKISKIGVKIKEVAVSHFPRQYGKQTGAKLKVISKAFFELIWLYKNLK